MMNVYISAVFIFVMLAGLIGPASALAVPMESNVSVGLATEPGGLEAIAVSSSAIDLYWQKEQYGDTQTLAVMRGDDVVTQVPASSAYFRDSNLSPDTLYTYRLIPISGNELVTEQASKPVTEKTYPAWRARDNFDVIVAGGTASGVAAARSAAIFGARVALIEETNRLGGMSSNGLGRPDIRESGIRANGFFQRMREHVKEYYGKGDGLAFEPRVANAAVKSLLYEYPSIIIFRKVRVTDVIKQDGTVTGLAVKALETGETADFQAPVVIDATIEGDIAAAAGAPYRVGREARTPEEPHNGFIYYDNQTDTILPGSTGKADKRVQSYSYLLTVKDYGPGADRSIPEPPNYDKNNYLYSPEWKKSWAYTSGKLPNNKYEINQHPWGTDLPGINYHYPEAGPSEREEVDRRYRDHALGYLYYLQTEQGLKNIGLADDEYRDNGNFPPTLYVREARRVEGFRIMNESDVWKAREFVEPESIAIGDYPMDSHAVENPPSPDVRHRGEGEWWLVKYTPWYHTPMDVLVPRRVQGLLVSSAVSATHVGYGTLRMEPVRFSMGEAAGAAAVIAVELGIPPALVPASLVQERLLSIGSYATWYKDVKPDTPHFDAIQFIGVRGVFRDENFNPDEPLSYNQAIEWIVNLAFIEGRKVRNVPPGDPASGITRQEFAQLLVQYGFPEFAAQAFIKDHSATEGISRAEGAFGLYLAHREYALGSRAFSARSEFVRSVE